MKASEKLHWRRSGTFAVNLELTPKVVFAFITDFEHAFAFWGYISTDTCNPIQKRISSYENKKALSPFYHKKYF